MKFLLLVLKQINFFAKYSKLIILRIRESQINADFDDSITRILKRSLRGLHLFLTKIIFS